MTPTFTIDGPTIGEHQFAPHRVAVVDLALPNGHTDRPMDMILGYPTLRQVDWIMDFPRDRWTLLPPLPGGRGAPLRSSATLSMC